MKNIQITDGADNATYSIFQATDDEFRLIFPGEGQDLEIVEDLFHRLGEKEATGLLIPLWDRPIHKRDAHGIHGTLFYDYVQNREHLPATKREIDRTSSQINQAERDLYATLRADAAS
ncbi:hypothetical protein [Phenylobacterium sp.]|uniref:hypothetical protein n=1 Tax=Phenylobacterium sp. TaxID=1871053 RepID=UPI002734C01E|nr:hypothetical protein [Phenylobacterium sp.]MDP3852775.1 hypothetical protein [Phenylobacterium sp.]